MKKIIIIFIIVCCLLFLLEIFCTAREPYNYGKIWNSWSDHMRSVYIMGLKDGLQNQIFFLLLQNLKEKKKMYLINI